MAGRNELLVIMLAVLSGFWAGTLSTRTQSVQASGTDTIRAKRFELLNDLGKPVAFWGSDEHRHIVLTFLGPDMSERASLGLGAGEVPFMGLAGKDGKVRVGLQLGWGDKPSIALNDENMEGRIILGFVHTDAPSPRDDDWGLILRAPKVGPRRDMAYMAIMRDYKSGRVSGKIKLRDSNGKTWSAP